MKKKCLLIGLLTVILIPTVGITEDRPVEPEYAKRGASTCLKCHDEPTVTLIFHTPHAQKSDPNTPFAKHECESCHGASPEHISKRTKGEIRPKPVITFGSEASTPVADQNQICLTCHQQSLQLHWQGSEHQFADLACVSCHTLHIEKDTVLVKKTQAPVCYHCHAEQRAQAHRRSRHPIKEGKVTCTDCHNPHGSTGEHLLVEDTVNETCFTCHAEKRGPFLWEHPPAQEDCSICHTSHGSTQPNLLRVRAPYLCQQCHSEAESFHVNVLNSGDGLPANSAQSRLLAKSCLNCHSKIHGSNHPSGVRFDR